MCQLNCLFIKKKQNDITSFIQSIMAAGFLNNNHGCGIYTSSDNIVRKSDDLINGFEIKEQIENSKVILTHQRYATSGHSIEYHHPFESNEFLVLHNGIMNQFLKDKGSDTSGFFEDFQIEFNLLKGSREQKIIDTINKLFKDGQGSYSILIYDKISKLSYYFKNTPEINFYRNKDYLFVTTNSDNQVFLSLLGTDFIELDIQPRIIYRIENNLQVFRLEKMPEIIRKKDNGITIKGNHSLFDYSKYGNFKNWDIEETEEDFSDKTLPICSECNQPILHKANSAGTTGLCFDCYEKYFNGDK